MSQDQGRRREDPDYGLGEATIDVDRLGLLDGQELTDRLVRTFEAPDYRPPRLPAVATELMTLSQNPDVEFDEIEALLEQDAMLAGGVLAVARSAHYQRTVRVDSLRDALVRIGLNRLRSVVMQAAMNLRVFRSRSYKGCMESLRDHCRATAHLCRLVSRYTPIDEEQAFLAGLLHDVGIAGILLALGDVERGQKAPDLAVLWPSIHDAHGPAGARMVEQWGLSADTSMAVGHHHQVDIGGYPHPMSAVVCIAESVAAELGTGFVPEQTDDLAATLTQGIDRTAPAALAAAKEALGIVDATAELIRADGRAWAEAETATTA